MKTLFESKYQIVELHEEDGIIEATWKPETDEMMEDEYKEEMLHYLSETRKHKPKMAIPNTTELNFPIGVELQDWTNENVFTGFLEISMTAAAFVISKDFFSQVSIEQTMEEEQGSNFKTKYFTDRNEAFEWLKGLTVEHA